MENQTYIRQLFQKYIDGQCNAAEAEELLQYLQHTEDIDFVNTLIQGHEENANLPRFISEAQTDETLQQSYQNIRRRIHVAHPVRRKLNYLRYSAAATIVVVLSISLYFYSSRHTQKEQPGNVTTVTPIHPGSNKAVLTLADGNTISLDEARNGSLATQEGAKITKTSEGVISYDLSTAMSANTAYNIITTPKGGQYKVILPDGTSVWLNASSSLKYPASFRNMDKRIVTLTGEGYFEVTHNARQPFIVHTEHQDIKVLGTHFDIKAYEEEEIQRTTLIQGSVSVNAGSQSLMLKPGEQFQRTNSGIKKVAVDTESAVGWKNGKIMFRKVAISEALREIARWYDIEIAYDCKVPDYTITGEASRQADLTALLDILKRIDVHYKQEGRTLTILQ